MNIKDFEHSIDATILYRGKDYFESNFVKNLHKISETKWKATVKGSQNYHVFVDLEGDDIVNSRCNCPFDWGPICKHEVAVFLALKEKLFPVSNAEKSKSKLREESESNEEKLNKIFTEFSKEELIKIIFNKTLEDDEFFYDLITTYGFNKKDQNWSKKKLKNIICSTLDSAEDYGFISYNDSYSAVKGAENLLQKAEDAIEEDNFQLVINISQAVIEEMVPALQCVDDSDGVFRDAIEESFENLYLCSEKNLSDELRKELFSYLLKESINQKYNGWSDCQIDFISIASNLLRNQKDAEQIFQKMDILIERESNKDHSFDFIKRKLSVIRFEILSELGLKSKAETFFVQNINQPAFRRMSLEKAYENKDYNEVEKIALDGEKNDEKYAGLVFEWKRWRLKAYQESKNIPGIRSLALDLFFQYDTKYYDILKKTYSQEEWAKVYPEIIKQLEKNKEDNYKYFNLKATILKIEKEFEELLKLIQKFPLKIHSYESYLLPHFKEQVYKIYERIIYDSSSRASNRNSYAEICRVIRHLKKIDGKQIANEIIHNLKNTNKRRPAFLDELSKIR